MVRELCRQPQAALMEGTGWNDNATYDSASHDRTLSTPVVCARAGACGRRARRRAGGRAYVSALVREFIRRGFRGCGWGLQP